MKKNKIKKMMAEGKTIINGWLQIPGSFQFTLAKGVVSVVEIDWSICNALG